MKKTIQLLTLGLMTAILLLCLAACSNSASIKLEPYITAKFTGTNGNGTAVFSFSYSGFEQEAMSSWKGDEQLKKLAELTEVELTMKLDKTTAEGLSNGDTVTVTMTYDKDKAKKAGLSFTDVSRTFTVEGLTEAIMIDPFDESVFGEGKTVFYTLDDVSPYLVVNIHNNAAYDDPLSNVIYRTSPGLGYLKNGDTFTLTAEFRNSAASQGYALSRTELTVEVQGYDSYITSADQLSTDILQRLGDIALQMPETVYFEIHEGNDRLSPGNLQHSNKRLGDTALLCISKNGPRIHPILLVIPVYETLTCPNYFDMSTFQTYERTWENMSFYFTFNYLVLHADGTYTWDDYIESYGAYSDEATAEANCLSYLREYYDIIEIPMP